MGRKKKTLEYNLFEDFEKVDDGNIFAETVVQAANGVQNKEPVKKTKKIEDFGEKIGGARKDLYAAYCDLMKEAMTAEAEKVPLSKSFPAPNYKKLLETGIEIWKVDAVRALRDTVPMKPKTYSWKIKEWAEEMTILRDMSISVLEDKWTSEEFSEELEKFKKRESEYSFTLWDCKTVAQKIEDYMLIYSVMGHEKDYSTLAFEKLESYDYRYDEENPIELREMHGEYRYKILGYGATKYDALDRYKMQDRSQEKSPPDKKNTFKIYSWRHNNYYFIGCKIGKEYVEMQSPFKNVEEAQAYLNAHLTDLEEKLKKYRHIPYERESENTPRTGELKRKVDVTPEQFQETFGFRGVEFGTWVENKNRQESLNKAYDALMDMSEALNLPPRALSLNGSLGLAFGARGRGGNNAPLAHYEPVKVVINLTKKNGAGSLGHEWFHSVDNYFGRKERADVTTMLTHNANQVKPMNISEEVTEGFRLVQSVINNSELITRCQNLDKRRNKEYWTLPEEMAARAFEVYLKAKLEENGIRNDYLVNYRSEESWEKATAEKSFKMENTYPYPTKSEMEDIKAAYEYLFDSMRFRAHDKNYELYSASSEKISEIMKEARLMSETELTEEQSAIQKMSEEVFGICLKFFDSAPEIHGRYDEDSDIMYLNGKAETALDWTFWHEALHLMKKHEPELYEDIFRYVERHEFFSSQQMEEYRKAVKQPTLSDSKVVEEMMADAFADMKTGRRIVEKIAEKNQNVAQKFLAFTKKLVEGVKKFFKAKEVKEKYPEVALTNGQFKNFVERIDENILSLQGGDKMTANSTGYKILRTKCALHSLYAFAPKKQKKFDTEFTSKLVEKYPSESVQQAIQELSPLGRKDKNYGAEVLREVRSDGR